VIKIGDGESEKMNCLECTAEMKIPEDAIDGEIVTCPDCGTSFELDISQTGEKSIKPAETVGEDWGE
jgi:alpha-aminoadipate/glutamate carrier protein LysW